MNKKIFSVTVVLFSSLIACATFSFAIFYGHLHEVKQDVGQNDNVPQHTVSAPAAPKQETKNNYTPPIKLNSNQKKTKTTNSESNKPSTGLILNKILNGETITYCLDFSFQDKTKKDIPRKTKYVFETDNNGIKSKTKYTIKRDKIFDAIATSIPFALQQWTSGTADFIKNSGEKNKFTDIMPILERPVKTKQVKCPQLLGDINQSETLYQEKQNDTNVDLYVYMSDRCIKHYGNGRYRAGYQQSKYLNNKLLTVKNLVCIGLDEETTKDVPHVLVHEIGHTLGLSDMYAEGMRNTDWNYASRKVDGFDETGRSYVRNSIMGDGEGDKILCDDADGLITLIDRYKNIRRGGSQGWLSMCRDRVYVQESDGIKTPVFYDEQGRLSSLRNENRTLQFTYEGNTASVTLIPNNDGFLYEQYVYKKVNLS